MTGGCWIGVTFLALVGAAVAPAAAQVAEPAVTAEDEVAALCYHGEPAAPALARLRSALGSGRFVAYQPNSLTVVNGAPSRADAASIRADLAVLRARFDSLVTYDAIHGAEQIPGIAAALHYRALIIGVWNPFDAAELDAALEAAAQFPQLVVGVSLGNEMLFAGRTDAGALTALAAQLHARAPALPLSVSEPFHVYEKPAAGELLAQLDFLLPNVHPAFQPWFHGASVQTSAQFVVNVVGELADRFCGPILVKETGVPSAPQAAGFSDAGQADFYRELRLRFAPRPERAFAYFAAFEAPWRAQDVTPVGPAHPEEAHWGLYDTVRRPKRAGRELPPLTSAREPP